MAIASNNVHVRVVKCWNALQAHPQYLAYMEPALRDRLKAQAALVAPLLVAAESATDDDRAAASIEARYEETRQMIKRVNLGLEYRYAFKHSAQLKELAPLTLGANPAEDEVKIATQVRVVPTLRPPFLWIADDGFTFAALTKTYKGQQEARASEAALGSGGKNALAGLRAARPASKALWSEDNGLDAWIIAHIPVELQYAFGRERRSRPRASDSEPATTTTAAAPAGDGEAAKDKPAPTEG